MHTKQNYGGLDRFRIAAALLVVAIHTSPLAYLNEDADFFLTRILARVAVPFFFMVTGQFVVSAFDTKTPFPYIKKMALLYGLSILLYLPIGIYAGHYDDLSVPGVLRMVLFDGTFYHLWYFPACIIGILLLWLMSRFMNRRGMLAVSVLLYLVGLFGDSYYGLTEQVPVLKTAYSFLFRLFSHTRNGLFLAPVFLLAGAWMSRRFVTESNGTPESVTSAKKRVPAVIGLILSFAAMTAEAFTLRYFGLQRHDSMYLALIPTMLFLYRLLAGSSTNPHRLLRTAATWIYLLHPAMIVVVRGSAKVLSATGFLVENGILHYLAVIFLSAAAAFPLSVFVERMHRRTRTGRTRAWIELDRNALAQNVRFLQSRLPEGCALMPAVKAEAYGHGAVLISKELNRLGIHSFCVASAEEGAALRKAGITGEILVLGYTHPDSFFLLRRHRLTQTIVDYSYAVTLNGYGKKIPVHIGVDTGMHRLGERCENVDQISAICEMPNLSIKGMFTHLSADDSDEPACRAFTEEQAASLYLLADELERRGYPCPKLHLQASYGVLNYPELSGDYARVGIALYGVLSTVSDTEAWAEHLHPVLSLKATVASVRDLYEGESAGYGMDFTAEKDMRIAALTIGYADGLPRTLSDGKGCVLIRGCKAPIVGRICMDQTIVDVTGIPDVAARDVAVLIGVSGQEQISASGLAEAAGTITNEILSRLGSRLERCYSESENVRRQKTKKSRTE